jgi:hypothetical protein
MPVTNSLLKCVKYFRYVSKAISEWYKIIREVPFAVYCLKSAIPPIYSTTYPFVVGGRQSFMLLYIINNGIA